MLNILFYTPFNSRSRDTESLMQAFVQQGHRVFLLTQTPRGDYHASCESFGVTTQTHVLPKFSSFAYFIKHSWYLIRFCREHKIQVVYAHLENAALPAVLGQYFIKSRVFSCRHIVDEAYLMNSTRFKWLNKIVYTLSQEIIVVSERSKNWMVQQEGIRPTKIRVIPLAYNFKLYPEPDPEAVQQIRFLYPCKLLLLTACRMTKGKRPELSIELLEKLLGLGLDVKLLLLGDGPLLTDMKRLAMKPELQGSVYILGHQQNIMDYLSACDLLVHPSVQDASSVIIKEAGLCGKTVICCRGIGDVDDYLVHGQNAFLVSANQTVQDMQTIISEIQNKAEQLKTMGQQLQNSVKQRFEITPILEQYQSIHIETESKWKN
ncbi:MAG TPA: glycosyltransferase family 4 protein [Bacteroidia bacterium]|nr:glycosyltransferase family 4 protein [Bacteroidia bacterium]